MGFIKKYAVIIVPICLIVFYFISRYTNILALPIFTDEAIYVRWSQIAANDASWRFISLTDGKQPLFVWIAMVLMKIIHDPLMAGRMVSVLAGFLSMAGMFFLTNELFSNKKTALLASFLYIFYPFSLVYDRLALYDSLVAMFIIWSLYFEVLLVKYIRLDLAMILGMIIGGGMLTKVNAEFSLAFLPVSLLLFDIKDKNRRRKFLLWVIYAMVVIVLAFLIYSILRLSPFFYIIDQKTAIFVYPLKEWLHHPFTYFLSNMSSLISWLLGYMTIPFFILVIAAFIPGGKHLREKIFLILAFLLPFLYLAFFGRQIYPRFILFMTMPLIVLGAYSLYYMVTSVKQLYLKIIVLVVFLLMFFVTDFFIITDFSKAAIPQADREQLITGWPSGIGVRESLDFFRQQSQNQKIYVGTEGTFGLMPYSLELYTQKNPNIKIKGFWPVTDQPPQEAVEASKKMPTYFVFYQLCSSCQATGIAPAQWKVKEIMQFTREDKNSYYTVYQLLP